jgi:hypothetical protein
MFTCLAGLLVTALNVGLVVGGAGAVVGVTSGLVDKYNKKREEMKNMSREDRVYRAAFGNKFNG